MQDLAQIRRQNNNALGNAVPNLVAEGKHVVVTYTGLNYYDHKAFDNAQDARAHAEARSRDISFTVKTYSPEPVLH